MKWFLIILLSVFLIVAGVLITSYNIFPESIITETIQSATFLNGLISPQGEKLDGNPFTFNLEFERGILVQLEVDEDYPCHIQGGNQIVCEVMNNTQKEKLESKLTPEEKQKLDSTGIPIINLEGSPISERNLDYSKENIIDVDLSQRGIFQIGFHSNLFEITDFTLGGFNRTQESGDEIIFGGSYRTGNYFTQIMDLNTTKMITNVTFDWGGSSGSQVGITVRTHNMSNGTDLSEGLIMYQKFDSSEAFDFSGNNHTGTLGDDITLGDGSASDIKVDGNTQTNGLAKFGGVSWDFNDQIDSYVEFADNAAYSGLSEMTIVAWVNPDASQDRYATVVSKQSTSADNSQQEYKLLLNGNSKWRFIVWNAAGTATSRADGTSDYVDDDSWTCLAGTYDGTNAKIWVNGVNEGTGAAISTDIRDTATPMRIGKDPYHHTDKTFDGLIDEVAMWNRSLTQTEIEFLCSGNGHELIPWSDFSTIYESSPSSVDIDDGRYVQARADLSRTSSLTSVHLDSLLIGYDDIGTSVEVDNAPTVVLDTQDEKAFTILVINLSATLTDDIKLVNASLFTNTTGTWHLNQSVALTGTTDYANFSIKNVTDGGYIWNVLGCDNSTAIQCSWATNNKSFSVSTACVDTDCYPYVCNDEENSCYTKCSSHDHVNASSFCNVDGDAETAYADTLDCAYKELFGLTDDEVCTSQVLGYCFNDTIGSIGEYCTSNSTGCVNDGTEYEEGEFTCVSPNDAHMCLGGEEAWDTILDCIDLGDPYDASASVTGHTYCGYYEAQTCDTTNGCVGSATQDCGPYFYNETAKECGQNHVENSTYACDVGCGATYDLETLGASCPPPNHLSEDCTTCTAPAVDDPPVVYLHSPLDNATETSTTVNILYSVTDNLPLANCSLWFNSTSIPTWHLNITNQSAIIRSETLTNTFTVTFNDLDDVMWNVECFDSIGNSSYADTNWTFRINTTVPSIVGFEFYISDDTLPSLSINESGDVNISKNLYVDGILYVGSLGGGAALEVSGADLSGEESSETLEVQIAELKITKYMDIEEQTYGVKFVNPYNDYLRISGKSENAGNLLFGLSKRIPEIKTETGKYIWFNSKVNITQDIYAGGNITHFGEMLRIGESVPPVSTTQNVTIRFGSGDPTTDIIRYSLGAVNGWAFKVAGNDLMKIFGTGDLVVTNDVNSSGELFVQGLGNSFVLGKLGIATPTPYTELDVIGEVNITENLYINDSLYLFGNVSKGDIYMVGEDESYHIYLNKDNYWYLQQDAGTHHRTYIDVDQHRNTAYYQQLDGSTFTITGDEIGIGTASPSHKLNVVGDLNVTGDIHHGGSLVEYSPMIVESEDNTSSIIGMKADDGQWVGCNAYYNKTSGDYEFICKPSSKVDTKITKIETTRQLKQDCESQVGWVFNYLNDTCYKLSDEEIDDINTGNF